MPEGHTITITPTTAHIDVKVGGQLVASTDHPTRLEETGLPVRWYLPREDVRMDLLRPTTFHTTCPFKGEASYWSIEVDGQTHDGIVWSYEEPIERSEGIRGLMCFYADRAEHIVRDEESTSA